MDAELEAKMEEAEHPVHLLQLVGDSLPGIGIVAAVLGIINTMAAIADGPEVVGERVAAALTGTLLGILFAYGFVNPLANRIQFNNAADAQCLRWIKHAVAGFAKGLAPLTAVEIARRSLDSAVQPGAQDLEAAAKALAAGEVGQLRPWPESRRASRRGLEGGLRRLRHGDDGAVHGAVDLRPGQEDPPGDLPLLPKPVHSPP